MRRRRIPKPVKAIICFLLHSCIIVEQSYSVTFFASQLSRIWDTCSGNQIGSIHLDDHPPSPTTVGSSAHSMLLYHNDECLVQLSSWRNNPEQNYFGAFDLDTEEKVMESKAGEFVAYSMTLTADETRLILYGDSVDILDVSEKKPVSIFL